VAVKKATVKKKAAPKKKLPAKKAAPKKAVAKKKATSKKATAKKASAKKSPTKKKAAPKKKTVVKKATAKKKASSKKHSTLEAHKRHQKRVSESLLPSERIWLLEVPYELRQHAQYVGARWDPALKRWYYKGSNLPNGLNQYSSQHFSWERWLEDDLNTSDSTEPAPSGVTLRPHQQEAADAIAKAYRAKTPGFLLADDVGLGKTYATLSGINQCGEGLKVLILCPLSVVAHWRRSIATMGANKNRWCVLNYDRVKSLMVAPGAPDDRKQRTRTKNKAHATKGAPLVEWDVVVLDESHKLKNPVSQRTSATRRVSSAGTGAFCVYLSATAGQNPLELSYLAQLLAKATGSRISDLNDFDGWCKDQGFQVKKGGYGQWSWDRNDRDLEVMRSLLFESDKAFAMRRRPQDISGWPELQRVMFPQELDPQEYAAYLKAWEEFREALALDPRGKDSPSALVAALRLRQKASLLRCKQTALLAIDLVEQGLQVAISTQFLETGSLITAELEKARVKVSNINGGLNATIREEQRIEFQQGKRPVVVFTVTEGISLHAGESAVAASDNKRVLLLHDMRWSALDVAQIEGRCHRDGENAAAWYLYAPETVEEKVASAVLHRLEDMGSMLGDDTTGLEAMWDML
jgi:SNF2 family DNA or RNA helicase